MPMDKELSAAIEAAGPDGVIPAKYVEQYVFQNEARLRGVERALRARNEEMRQLREVIDSLTAKLGLPLTDADQATAVQNASAKVAKPSRAQGSSPAASRAKKQFEQVASGMSAGTSADIDQMSTVVQPSEANTPYQGSVDGDAEQAKPANTVTSVAKEVGAALARTKKDEHKKEFVISTKKQMPLHTGTKTRQPVWDTYDNEDAVEDSDNQGGVRYPPCRNFVYPPSDFVRPEQPDAAPEEGLDLQYIYGYRGKDCRNNLFYAENGLVVYFVASIAIVLNKNTNEQKFFKGHDDEILSLAMHPDGKTIATSQSGLKPYICVWNVETLERISTMPLQRGACCLAFSADGKRLASVSTDPDHTLRLWNWQECEEVCNAVTHRDQIFGLSFSRQNPDLLVTVGVKHVKFWTIKGKTLTGRKGIFGKHGQLQAVLCCAFNEYDDAMITGTYSGDIYVWNSNQIQQVLPRVHNGPVYAIDCNSGGIITGGKDGKLLFWDSRNYTLKKAIEVNHDYPFPRAIRSIHRSDTESNDPNHVLVGTGANDILEADSESGYVSTLLQSHFTELSGLDIHPMKPVFITAGMDKTLRTWNCKDMKLLMHKYLDEEAKCVSYSSAGKHVAVGYDKGGYEIFQVTGDELTTIHKGNTGARGAVNVIRFSPDMKFVAVGCENFIDILTADEEYARRVQFRGHSSTVLHMDWSKTSHLLQSNCAAHEILYWSPESCGQVRWASKIRDVEWETWTCVLGWPVQGIWPENTDEKEVSALCRSHDGKVVATTDATSKMKLFRFPCIVKNAKYHKYVGHGSHLKGIRWTCDDSTVLSVGGKDTAIFQWALSGREEAAGAHDDSSNGFVQLNPTPLAKE